MQTVLNPSRRDAMFCLLAGAALVSLPDLGCQTDSATGPATADGPSPIASSLVKIHKIVTRALAVSIHQCAQYSGKTASEEDLAGLTLFVTTLAHVAHGHHLTESELVFPYFKDKVQAPYAQLEQEHQSIAAKLVDLTQSASEIASRGVGPMRDALQDVEKIWAPHIHIEESRFTADNLRRVVSIQQQDDLVERFAKHSRDSSGPAPFAVPFLLYNLDGEDREEFNRQFPWVVRSVLVPFVWKKKWEPMRRFLLV